MSASRAARQPIPGGAVSTIRGRLQAPALTWASRVAILLGVASALVPDPAARTLATAVVAMVVAVPLLRVAWLVFRWRQERDARFVGLGLALLGVVGLGALLAAAGVGS